MATKIGIIGDGNVGGALARGFKRVGHEVRAVGKDPGAIREAASWAEVVLLAVPFAQHMDSGRLSDQPLTAFVAAEDAAAKQTVWSSRAASASTRSMPVRSRARASSSRSRSSTSSPITCLAWARRSGSS